MTYRLLNNEELYNVLGGTGEAIYRICPKCKESFQAGNYGVDHRRYPLLKICPACSERKLHSCFKSCLICAQKEKNK